MNRDVRKQMMGSVLAAALAAGGCQARRQADMYYQPPTPPQMLGYQTDTINQRQEENAEASKYVIYQHEFQPNEYDEVTSREVGGLRLNEAGEDHLMQIALMLRKGSPYPVVIERSNTSIKADTEFRYPVHYNPELDLARREVVVAALKRMGIEDAEYRVVVADDFAAPLTDLEASSAYRQGIQGGLNAGGLGAGGFGGGFGGGLGGGFGGGGLGGGFF
ncbi:MAG: hypothetical protein MPJ50_08065 [Pirellulales bacterium]|nr:hypothetical protein [Pirellulales bacterium]